MLEYLGCTSVCTFEGAEALRLYKQAQDDGNPFTGVILDLHNRLGKGGIETIVALRELDPEVDAVICSAYTDAPVMNQFLTHGFRGTLAKPFGLDDLDNILKYIL
jgi:CheY-like chemotaxis protein